MSRIYGRYPRVPRLVIGCRCGATCYPPRDGLEIICQKHYRLVDRALKRVRRDATRRGDHAAAHAAWLEIRTQAIERSLGI